MASNENKWNGVYKFMYMYFALYEYLFFWGGVASCRLHEPPTRRRRRQTRGVFRRMFGSVRVGRAAKEGQIRLISTAIPPSVLHSFASAWVFSTICHTVSARHQCIRVEREEKRGSAVACVNRQRHDPEPRKSGENNSHDAHLEKIVCTQCTVLYVCIRSECKCIRRKKGIIKFSAVCSSAPKIYKCLTFGLLLRQRREERLRQKKSKHSPYCIK